MVRTNSPKAYIAYAFGLCSKNDWVKGYCYVKGKKNSGISEG